MFRLIGNVSNYDISKLIPKVKVPKFVADDISEYLPDNKDLCISTWSEDEYSDATMMWTDNHFETFLKAVLYGYEIEPEDRFILPMEGTHGSDSTTMYAIKIGRYWTANKYYDDMRAALPTVTQSQIDTAPDWVKAIKPVKVSDENETN